MDQEEYGLDHDHQIQVHAALLATIDEPAPQPFNGDEGDAQENTPYVESRVDRVKLAQQYIQAISMATLDNGKLDAATVERLRNPAEGPVDISEPDTRLSIDLFIACNNASQATYEGVRASINQRFPDCSVLSYHSAKKLVAELTGVVSITDDMCINSCEAFVGPKAARTTCSICSQPRSKGLGSKKVPQQQAVTIPLGPQIQALRRSVQGATSMLYRDQKMAQILEERHAIDFSAMECIYDDTLSGSDFVKFHERENIGPHDTTVWFSIDGAQIYQDKKSDTWIAIWIINDFGPTERYKKKRVLPALVVPGPNKPKDIDSFLFRSFHHLSALQREDSGKGIRIWDALLQGTVSSKTFFIIGTADAVGLTELDGRVGHHGAQGCRISCDMKGRHKPGVGHYYAVHLRPNGQNADDCNHPDYNFEAPPQPPSPANYQNSVVRLVASQDQTDYERNRKLTGISKPSILEGLLSTRSFPVPSCFTVDLMHLLFINLGELLIPMWRGALKCESTDSKASWDWAVLTGATWTKHGKLVAAATRYFPASFHRPPRNPAEKISSGYKATEYFHYLFGLGPAFFRVVLPQKYWKNFCKLAHGVRIIIQRSITAKQLREAHSYLTQFVWEYENLYYQRRMDRLHFCRPCLHTLLHTAPEGSRIGPGAYTTQFTMERAIGYLSSEIRQPSNIFGNLCQIALRRAQINALQSMCPELDPMRSLPRGAHNCRGGFVLLRPRAKNPENLTGEYAAVLEAKIQRTSVRKWAKLLLPNGQIARSSFFEENPTRRGPQLRVTRNVKVSKLQYITCPISC